MAQETAAHNIKNQLKSSTENESKSMQVQFYQDHERPSVDKKNLWRGM